MATLCYWLDSKIDDSTIEYIEESFIPLDVAEAKADSFNAMRDEEDIAMGLKYFVLNSNYTHEEFYY